MHKSILITGATGFLGSSIVKRLVQAGLSVIALTRSDSNCWRIKHELANITLFNGDLNSLEQLFSANTIDTILHCATQYGRAQSDPVMLLEANVLLPLKLLEMGAQRDLSCFINTDTVLDRSVNRYALTKNHLREWLVTYAPSIACINIALQHMYGPHDDESKFVTYLIRNLLINVDNIDLTQGMQKRDFMYIDDVVDAFHLILQHRTDLAKGYYSYEAGSGTTIELRELVQMIKELTGNTCTRLNFGALPYRPHEMMASSSDTTALQALGWQAKTSLHDGLLKTIVCEKERKTT